MPNSASTADESTNSLIPIKKDFGTSFAFNKAEESQFDIESLREELKELSSELKSLHQDFNKTNKKNFERDFDLLFLPTEGKFYPDGRKSLMIRYLTAVEEKILCNEFLIKTGRAYEFLMQNLIVDDDFDLSSLLLPDFQAILMFLRSTSYGDKMPFEYLCAECHKKNEHDVLLSSLRFKDPIQTPDENGLFYITLPKSNYKVAIKLLSYKDAMEIDKEVESDFFFYVDDGKQEKIRRTVSNKTIYNIQSINDIENRESIKKAFKTISKFDSDVLSKFIKECEYILDSKTDCECEFCGNIAAYNFNIGREILSLPPSFKESIIEEVFLLFYYGKGITQSEASQMPVYERRSLLNRISREIEKKNKAESDAHSAANRKRA